MRIWDLPCKNLCRQHLLDEHFNLHAIFTYITTDKGGAYRKHPETLRWYGKIGLLSERHSEQVQEMKARGYNHHSPLNASKVNFGAHTQDQFVHTIAEQKQILRNKKCDCLVN